MLDRRRAFTLMELLVVIGLIAVLVAVVFVIGRSVTSGAKTRLTADGLRVLDSALQGYIADMGDIPPPIAEDQRAVDPGAFSPSVPRNGFFPVADARDMGYSNPNMSPPGNQMINSAGLFVSQLTPMTYTGQIIKNRPATSAKAAIDSLPQRLLTTADLDPPPPPSGPPPVPPTPGRQPALMTPIDAWGRPMRYVHPAFDGLIFDDPNSASPNPDTMRLVQDPSLLGPARTGTSYIIANIRRNSVAHDPLPSPLLAQNLPDSDGGICIGNRPYFYSAGPDGKVGVLHDSSDNVIEDYNKDNVYTTRPTFPTKLD